MREITRSLSVTMMCGLWLVQAGAYETDQYTNRHLPLDDSTAVMNRKVNDTLQAIVAEWDQGPDEMAFVDAFYRELGGLHWVDRLERWAMKSPEVDKLEVGRYDSVFAGHPFWATRVITIFGTGKTIKLNDVLIGSDKIGHFISQGRKYYRRFRRSGSEVQAAEQSAYTERALFGSMTTGVYSNADVVANYEGHRFYRSLFEDDIVPGKPAILRWGTDGWSIQREFDWADHVNAYWDEALNVNHYDAALYRYMYDTFVDMCPMYWKYPELYTIENEDELRERYAHLQLQDTSELRLDSLCPVQAFLNGESEVRQEKSSPGAPASP
jgi:hypothetical protein